MPLLQKPTTTYTLPLSLLIHLALLLLIGGSVVVPMLLPTHPTPEAVPRSHIPDLPEPDKDPQDPEPTEPAATNPLVNPVENPAATPSPDQGSIPMVITADTSPSLSPPMTLSGTPGLFSTIKPGKPGTPSSSMDNKPQRKIKLWANEVDNVSKLGVILDVSGSAHGFLSAAIREVEKNFDHSPTLLVMGCGINPNVKASDVRVEVYGDSKPDKIKDKAGSRTSLGQLAMAESNIKGLDTYLKRMQKRDDVWQVEGGDVGATQFAFEKLVDEGVDTIYWFADFQDGVDPKMMQDLTRELKKHGIRVIAHNFSGKAVPAEQTKMARESGGQTLSLVPK